MLDTVSRAFAHRVAVVVGEIEHIVGTDRGAYVSLDTGRSWQAAGAGLPNVPVHDLIVHPRERELVAGTHGRSVWVLDALPIQDLSDDVRDSDLYVFNLEPITFSRGWQSRRSRWYYRPGDAPHQNIPFWVDSDGRAQWSVLDSDGNALRTGELDVVRGLELADGFQFAEKVRKDTRWSE